MRAYVLTGFDQDPELRDVADPEPGPGMRPMGVIFRSWSPRPDFQSSRLRVASVSMKPGAKMLTRTVGAKACA